MFSNYRYFLVLAEECNISRAAERLFITHQSLSKFLANLEAEYGVTLFERKPVFSLTYAGRQMLETLRQVETLEKNLRQDYNDLQNDKTGEVHLGTTEGRFRILMPDVVSDFRKEYPNVQLHITSASSPELRRMVLENKLDMLVAGIPPKDERFLERREVLKERLYLVISDNMLKEYFPAEYPDCKKRFARGVDLSEFTKVPFALNRPYFNSSLMLNRLLNQKGIELQCVHVSSHPDLHHLMTSRDYAASFCLTMYLPRLWELDESLYGNRLNVFPIEGLTDTNAVAIEYVRNRKFNSYGKELIRIIRRRCAQFYEYDL